MSHAVIHADALTYLRGNRWLAQNGYIPKAHAILCDPPYGLEFMGKEWDKPKPSGSRIRDPKGGRGVDGWGRAKLSRPDAYIAGEDFQAWVTEWAELLIDYVHPGALGLFFGGTRTYHRLATGLEDAGWEIADSLMWVYGSGFPKSASISKLLDKEAGAEREVVGVGTSGKNRNVLNAALHPETFGGPFALTAPATPLAARWEGYGTALKPAYETIVVARAPRGKNTYAALARTFGTGALAIDAARITTGAADLAEMNGRSGGHSTFGPNDTNAVYGKGLGQPAGNFWTPTPTGRWPANFGLVCTCEGDDHADDCPVSVLGRQSGVTTSTANPRNNSEFKSVAKGYEYAHVTHGHDDTGTAARFFYQAKAAGFERMAGLSARSTHPTTKPIKLAEYLARLILPPELDTPRRLLVPFAGSGSEMIGARLAGWDAVTGIEREAEYVALAEARLAWWAQFASYDDARAAYEKERKAKPALVVIEDKPEQIARTGR